jgi:cytochrome c oxidase subunit I
LHLTVGTAVTLSFMGITYWLLPHITGRKLWGRKVALWQAWTWFIGMIIFSNAMHVLGLLGAPRRTPLAQAPYVPAEWIPRQIQTGVGGAILLVSAILYFVVVLKTVLAKHAAAADVPEIPVAEAMRDPQQTPAWLDRWAPWLVATIVLIIIAYGPQLIAQISGMQLTSPGMRVW